MSNDRQAKIAAATGPQRNSNRTALGAVVALLVVVGVIVAIVLGTRGNDEPAAEGNATNGATSGEVKLPKGVADPNAPVVATNDGVLRPGVPTLQIFEDFQCPACKHAEDLFGPTIKDMGAKGEINVVYYVKTFMDDSLRNDSSKKVGNAALCASDADKFEDYHDKIYAKQPTGEGTGYTDEQVTEAAGEAGITGAALDTWKQCVADRPYVPYLNGLEEYTAQTMRVTSTPSFYVDNKRMALRNEMTAEDFRTLIRETAAK